MHVVDLTWQAWPTVSMNNHMYPTHISINGVHVRISTRGGKRACNSNAGVIDCIVLKIMLLVKHVDMGGIGCTVSLQTFDEGEMLPISAMKCH